MTKSNKNKKLLLNGFLVLMIISISFLFFWNTRSQPIAKNPLPNSGAPTLDQLEKTFSYAEETLRKNNHNDDKSWNLFEEPTIEKIQNSDWSKEYQELPRKEATNKDWYFTQMWKSEESNYDFQLLRFYYEQLLLLLKPKSEFNTLISPYVFKLNTKINYFSEKPEKNKDHPFLNKQQFIPLEIDNHDNKFEKLPESKDFKLEISNRSVYGLTIKSITFPIKYKVVEIDEDFKPESYPIKFSFKTPIKLTKEVFTTDMDAFIWVNNINDAKEVSSSIFSVNSNAFVSNSTTPPRIKFDSVYDNEDARSSYSLTPRNLDIFDQNLQKHLFDKKTGHHVDWEDSDKLSFSLLPNLSFSYIFIGNFYITKNQNDRNLWNQGIYLITSLNCEHNKNGEYTRDYEQFKKLYP